MLRHVGASAGRSRLMSDVRPRSLACQGGDQPTFPRRWDVGTKAHRGRQSSPSGACHPPLRQSVREQAATLAGARGGSRVHPGRARSWCSRAPDTLRAALAPALDRRGYSIPGTASFALCDSRAHPPYVVADLAVPVLSDQRPKKHDHPPGSGRPRSLRPSLQRFAQQPSESFPSSARRQTVVCAGASAVKKWPIQLLRVVRPRLSQKARTSAPLLNPRSTYTTQ